MRASGGVPRHVAAAERDLHRTVGLSASRDEVEQRGLARAIGADEAEDLALAAARATCRRRRACRRTA